MEKVNFALLSAPRTRGKHRGADEDALAMMVVCIPQETKQDTLSNALVEERDACLPSDSARQQGFASTYIEWRKGGTNQTRSSKQRTWCAGSLSRNDRRASIQAPLVRAVCCVLARGDVALSFSPLLHVCSRATNAPGGPVSSTPLGSLPPRRVKRSAGRVVGQKSRHGCRTRAHRCRSQRPARNASSKTRTAIRAPDPR